MLYACGRCIRFLGSHSVSLKRFSSTLSNPHGLHGSVSAHLRQLVLFTGRNFDTIPSHVNAVSPLYREICELLGDRQSSLFQYTVAVTDSNHALTSTPQIQWSAKANRFDIPSEHGEEEHYGAVIYPDNVEVPFPLSLTTVRGGELEAFCASLNDKVMDEPSAMQIGKPENLAGRLDVFVCTHGARDCRCGDVGASFYDALGIEVKRRKIGQAVADYHKGSGPIRVHRTTHIGGHRFAATCFTSTGDWYGLLSAGDATELVRHFTRLLDKDSTSSGVWWERWRGRTGLTMQGQLDLFDEAISQSLPLSSLELAESVKSKAKTSRTPLGDKHDIHFTKEDESVVTVGAYEGETVMDAAKRAGLVEATCGGFCECATCMVYLPPLEGKAPPTPEVSDEEDDQLEYAIFANDNSRLACQIPITKELIHWFRSGGQIILPPI